MTNQMGVGDFDALTYFEGYFSPLFALDGLFFSPLIKPADIVNLRAKSSDPRPIVSTDVYILFA